MNPLDHLNPEELVKMSDSDFKETIKLRSRALSAKALRTYEDVADNSDDDGARVNAADRILKYAEAQDESRNIPLGLSAEVFQGALAGLAALASIARTNAEPQAFRNVTPVPLAIRPIDLPTPAEMKGTPHEEETLEASDESLSLDV